MRIVLLIAMLALLARVQSAVIENSDLACACGDHSWTDTTSWLGGVVPGPADDVVLACNINNQCTGGTGWLTVSADVTLNSLDFDEDFMGIKSTSLLSSFSFTITTNSMLGSIKLSGIDMEFMNGFDYYQEFGNGGIRRYVILMKASITNRGVATIAPYDVEMEGGASITNAAGAELTFTEIAGRLQADAGTGAEFILNEGTMNILLSPLADQIEFREVGITNTGTLNILAPAGDFSTYMALDCNMIPGSYSYGERIDNDPSDVPPGGYANQLGNIECPNNGFNFPVVIFAGWNDEGKFGQYGHTPYMLGGMVNIDAYGSLYINQGEVTIPSTASWSVTGRLEFGSKLVVDATKPGATIVNCDSDMTVGTLYDGGAVISGSANWDIDFHAYEKGHWQGTGIVTVKRHYGLPSQRTSVVWTQSSYILAAPTTTLQHRMGNREELFLNNGAQFILPAGVSATMQRGWDVTTSTRENPGVFNIEGTLEIFSGAPLNLRGGSSIISGSVNCRSWDIASDECFQLGGPGTTIEATAEFTCDDLGSSLGSSLGVPFTFGGGQVIINGGTFDCTAEASILAPGIPLDDFDFCSCTDNSNVCDANTLLEKGVILEADVTWGSSIAAMQWESYFTSGAARHTLTYSGDLYFEQATAYENIDVVVEGNLRMEELPIDLASNWFSDTTFLVKGDMHFLYPGAFPPAGYLTTRGNGLTMNVEGKTFLGAAPLATVGATCAGYDESVDTLNFRLNMNDATWGSTDASFARGALISATLVTVSGTVSGNENYTAGDMLTSPLNHFVDLSDCTNFTMLSTATTNLRIFGTDSTDVERFTIGTGDPDLIYSEFAGTLIIDMLSVAPISAGMTWDIVSYSRENNPPFGQFDTLQAGTGWGSFAPGMLYEPNGEKVWRVVACDSNDSACQSNVRTLMPGPIDLTTTGAPMTTTSTTGGSSTTGAQGSTGSAATTSSTTGQTVVTSSCGALFASAALAFILLAFAT